MRIPVKIFSAEQSANDTGLISVMKKFHLYQTGCYLAEPIHGFGQTLFYYLARKVLYRNKNSLDDNQNFPIRSAHSIF